MFKTIANLVVKLKWLVVIVWLSLAVLSFMYAPKLSDVMKSNQESFLPPTSESSQASKKYNKMFPDKEGSSKMVFVTKRAGGLKKQDYAFAKKVEKYLKSHEKEYMLGEVTSPYSNDDLKEYMISDNGEVGLAYYNLDVTPYTEQANKIISKLMSDVKTNVVAPDGLEYYWTGDAAINFEEHESVNKSMEVTVVITIFMVMTILLFIYRSPIAALIPLVTIGTSYTISKGVVGIAAVNGLGISSFTDTFLIAVLFGAGTDYCMLIITRYKEALSKGIDPKEALPEAMGTSAEAIFSSGSTVIIGFVCMLFAKFGLFNSTGPSVAIGVAITLIAVITLTPALLSIFGTKTFWPIKKISDPGNSVLWNKIAAMVVSKPVRFIMVALIVFSPFLFMTSKLKYSYDQLKDLPAANGSVKGFEIMKEGFAEGTIFPLKITVNADHDLWNTESLTYIDGLCEDLIKTGYVDQIMTASRPTGEKITKTSLKTQIKEIKKAVVKMGDGSSKLVSGIKKIEDGSKKLTKGLDKGVDGFGKMNEAMSELSQGLVGANTGIVKITGNIGEIVAGLEKSSGGLKELKDATDSASTGIKKSIEGLQGVRYALDSLVPAYQIKMTDPGYPGYRGAVEGIEGVIAALNEIDAGLIQISGGIEASGEGNEVLVSALNQINGGLGETSKGLDEIKVGMDKVNDGQKTAITKLGEAVKGLEKMTEGTNKLYTGSKKLDKGNVDLEKALRDNFLNNKALANTYNLPQSVIDDNEELRDAMGEFISKDGKGIYLNVILNYAPYDERAILAVDDIKMAATRSLVNTSLEGSEVHVGGITSAMNDIKHMIDRDFTIVMVSVLTGIFLILAALLRSVVAPIYLIISILISYACTMGLTTVVFEYILGGDGLHWAVPFFSFCILVALGVDYNIFLMSRIKEEYTLGDTKGAAQRGLATTGGIITSCGIIMMGTFGAMLISPVRPVVQIGFAAVVGLFLDTFVVRTLVVPALVSLIGEANWWPGNKKLKNQKI